MEKFRLISMVDFVLEITQKLRHNDDCEFAYVVRKYANFLKQPLTLGMFVPCDENGNVLEEPKNYELWTKKALNTYYDLDLSKYEKYQKAKESILFVYKPHFDLSAIKHQISQGKNIEYLANHGSIELTESSKKLIYG